MNKKILIISLLTITMFIAISFASAVGSNTSKTLVKKENSPLFGIRTKKVIKDRLEEIKTNYISDRLYLISFLKLVTNRYLKDKGTSMAVSSCCFTVVNPKCHQIVLKDLI